MLTPAYIIEKNVLNSKTLFLINNLKFIFSVLWKGARLLGGGTYVILSSTP